MIRALRVLLILFIILLGLSVYANLAARSISYIPLQDDVLKASSAVGALALGSLLVIGGWTLLRRSAQHSRKVHFLSVFFLGSGAVCFLLAVIVAANNWSNGTPELSISTPTVKWVFKTDRGIFSKPAVAEDTIYFGSAPGGLYAVDRYSGQECWHFTSEGGVDSDPVIAYEKVYFGAYGGTVYGLDYRTGREVWKFKPAEYGMVPCPIISKSTLYFASCIWLGSSNTLIAADLSTSTEKWRYEPEQAVLWTPAIISPTLFLVISGGTLEALDNNSGKHLWKFQLPDVEFTRPEVLGNEVYVHGNDGNFYAVDALTGQEKWRVFTQPQKGTPVAMTLVDGVAYFGVRNYLYVIDVRSHELLWRYRLNQNIMTAPAVADGIVYVGTHEGPVYALDMRAKREKWRFAVGNDVIGSPAVVDGVVYFGSQDGNFYAVQ